MRSSAVVRFGVGLLVGSVRASPCKPHSTTTTLATSTAISSSWASDVSSSTIISSLEPQASSTTLGLDVIETTATAENTTTTADVSSSSIVSSVETTISSAVLELDVNEGTTTATNTFTTTDGDDATTTELSNISEATSSAVPTIITSEATTTAADTATTIDLTTTSEDTTSAILTVTTSEAIFSVVTTTTAEATTSAISTTTTSEAPWPLETFAIISSPESGPLMGSTDLYRDTYFGADDRYYTPLSLTIEPETNRLRIAGGRYLCTAWGVFEWPGAILTCDVENSEVKYIECTQSNNGELSCRGEAVQCGFGPGGLTCSSNGDYVSQFLVQQQEDGYRLFLAYAPSDEFSGVTLKAVQAETQ